MPQAPMNVSVKKTNTKRCIVASNMHYAVYWASKIHHWHLLVARATTEPHAFVAMQRMQYKDVLWANKNL